MPSLRSVARLAAVPVAMLLGVAGAPPATAASVPTTPTSSWAPWKACVNKPAENCAMVRAVTTTADGTVFLGGDFTHLRSQDGTRSLAMKNLAALDASGAPAAGVATHTLNDRVHTLVSDGASVYAGGNFSSVDGKPAGKVARFDAATGARLPFSSAVVGTVHAMTLSGGKLYIGGKFSAVQGAPRGSLAALDAGTGVVDPRWAPAATLIVNDVAPNTGAHNSTPVRTMAASADGSRVYVAGDLDLLNGDARATIAAVDPVTGAADPTFDVGPGVTRNYQGFQLAVVDATLGRVPGVVLAGGGKENRSFRFNLDGSVAWNVYADGDAQGAAVIGDTVYLGGHFTEVCKNCYDANTTDDIKRMHIAAFPYTTGGPTPDATWNPALGPTFDPYYLGVWTLHAGADDALYAGGVFKNYTAPGQTPQPMPKIAKFGATAAGEATPAP